MRPYSKRALSADFLEEMRRASRDKMNTGIELVLYAPEVHRDQEKEKTIKERLTEHFSKHSIILKKEKQKVVGLGVTMVILGIIAMISATLVLFNSDEKDLFSSFLIVFLEPAAWFLLWEGMDQIVFNSKNINPELDFYKKMSDSNSSIAFESYVVTK
jgi:hypothetical protein